MSREHWHQSNRPRAILYAIVRNKDGKALYLGKKNENGEEIFRLPHVICSNRSEPINQIINGLHVQTGIWAEPIEIKEIDPEEIAFDEEEFTVPSYEVEMEIDKEKTDEKNPKVWLAKGFTDFKWKKK